MLQGRRSTSVPPSRRGTDQVTLTDNGAVLVRFKDTPVQMPAPLDALIRDHLTRRGQASYASRNGRWLFPGGIPGNPLTTENIRSQLVARGIKPHDSRKAALFQLAAEVPTPILADLLGSTPPPPSPGPPSPPATGAGTSRTVDPATSAF